MRFADLKPVHRILNAELDAIVFMIRQEKCTRSGSQVRTFEPDELSGLLRNLVHITPRAHIFPSRVSLPDILMEKWH